jgi:hypothetical protein
MIQKTIEAVTNNNTEMLANESLLEQFKDLNLKNIFTQNEFEEIKIL